MEELALELNRNELALKVDIEMYKSTNMQLIK